MTSDEIKEVVSMRAVLCRYGIVPNRAGFIPCPFHKEKTASMKIYDRDYHCFGCGANGDIFDFIQGMEDVTFQEAFRSLGGSYSLREKKLARMREAEVRRERERKAAEELRFLRWRRERLEQVCRLLRMLDVLIPGCRPFSGEWEAAVRMREENRYKYAVLAFGTRQEQEEMRALDE